MDHFQAEEVQGNNPASTSVDFPQSQELFSDQEHREDDIVTLPHQSDNSTHNGNRNMEADEELERENFETRNFKYLDEEEPLSPISESGESDEQEMEYCDAKIVENSSFILNCRIPSKKEWKIQEFRADD